jgi:arylsulfatase A-like enzyme
MRRVVVPLALVAFLASSLVLGSLGPTLSEAKARSRPNVVIIMTDDQRWDTVTHRFMPQLTRILSDNPSITYTNAFVPNSLCCPSRASTLTGDYSHTTGVYGNTGLWGGFSSFTPLPEGRSASAVDDSSTMAVDMRDAGYRTALIGKYLNGYPSHHFDYVPPGWDRWFVVGTGVYYNYYAATLNGRSWRYGSAPQDYITRVLSNKAKGFVHTLSDQPFFLYYATTAPHAPAIPDPRDVGRFDLSGYKQPPSFGEAEAGAPRYIEDMPWDAATVEKANAFHESQLDTNFGVDRSIGEIWDALPANTVVLFMSDNGYTWGEHKWRNKQVPYDESLRIPMMVVGKELQASLPKGRDRCPSMYRFTTSCDARLVLNVDVVPTLEGFAGVMSGHPVEGLDMFASARNDFVLEHWNGGVKHEVPTYCGIRSADWMYVRYNKSEEPVDESLFDERADPFEMNNLAVTDPTDAAVAAQLDTLRHRAAVLCQVGGGIYPDDWPY